MASEEPDGATLESPAPEAESTRPQRRTIWPDWVVAIWLASCIAAGVLRIAFPAPSPVAWAQNTSELIIMVASPLGLGLWAWFVWDLWNRRGRTDQRTLIVCAMALLWCSFFGIIAYYFGVKRPEMIATGSRPSEPPGSSS